MTLVEINHKKVTGLTFLPLLEQAPLSASGKGNHKDDLLKYVRVSTKFLNYQKTKSI